MYWKLHPNRLLLVCSPKSNIVVDGSEYTVLFGALFLFWSCPYVILASISEMKLKKYKSTCIVNLVHVIKYVKSGQKQN